MDAEEYAKDFKTEDSKQEFRCLLDQARPSDIWQAPDWLEREEAYERAGRYVVDRCDAIIAVWNGEKSRGRGGTAEIVGYAQEKRVPIAWVHTTDKSEPSYALENSRADVVKEAASKLRKYNTSEIDSAEFDQHMRDTAQRADAGHGQGNTHRPARPVPGGGGRAGYSLTSSAPTSWPCAISVTSAGSAWPSSSWPPRRSGSSPCRRISGPT